MGSLSSSVMLSPAGTISPTASSTALTKIQTYISTLKTIFLFTIVGALGDNGKQHLIAGVGSPEWQGSDDIW